MNNVREYRDTRPDFFLLSPRNPEDGRNRPGLESWYGYPPCLVSSCQDSKRLESSCEATGSVLIGFAYGVPGQMGSPFQLQTILLPSIPICCSSNDGKNDVIWESIK